MSSLKGLIIHCRNDSSMWPWSSRDEMITSYWEILPWADYKGYRWRSGNIVVVLGWPVSNRWWEVDHWLSKEARCRVWDERPMHDALILRSWSVADVGQSEPCMVCLSFVFVIDVNWVFDWGLVLGLGPLWSPSCVLVRVLSGRPSPHIQDQVWSHLEPLKWVKCPSGCVCGLHSLFYYLLWPIL